MGRKIIAVLVLAGLAGCGGFADSKLNPVNWFGSGKNEDSQLISAEPVDPALRDSRPLIDTVESVQVERAAGGAILHATGVASTQGFFGAELVPLAGETPVNGALVYFFRVEQPFGQLPIGSARTRSITVARFLPDSALSGARSIVVRAQNNQRRSSR